MTSFGGRQGPCRVATMDHEPEPIDHEGRSIDFGRTSIDYEQYRPGFPDGFFDRLGSLRWIAPGLRALDLGTGTGTLALGFATRGMATAALDIADELLEVARQNAIDSELDIRFFIGKAEETGEPDAVFDLVSAGQCWWWFDSDRAAVEASRILVPGGRLLICNFSYLPLPGNVAERTEDLILEHNPGWTKAGWPGVHPEQMQALDAAGFADVVSFSYTVDVLFTPDAWRGRIRTCNGVGSVLTTDQVERFDADLAGMLTSEFPETLTVPHRIFAASGRTAE
jgi:SAM-dependent methyltransferase